MPSAKPKTPKQRIHNEYFRPVSSIPRCPCGERYTGSGKLDPNRPYATTSDMLTVWSWGEYIHGTWHTVIHFCFKCFIGRVQRELLEHRENCGCTYRLIPYHTSLPNWIILPDEMLDEGEDFTTCQA